MKYPKFLQKGDTIGITAPSDGNRKEMDYQRLDLAVKKMESLECPISFQPKAEIF